MSPHLIGKHLLLCLIAVFEELLYHIIPKNIGHELSCIRVKLTKHLILLVTIGCLKFLLNKSRAMLIATEFDDVFVDVLINQHMAYSEVE